MVDLHRGVSDNLGGEMSNLLMTQQEVQLCQCHSAGLSFIVRFTRFIRFIPELFRNRIKLFCCCRQTLVGDRYGGAIFPPSIQADEFETLTSYTDDECVNILNHWFELDNNSVPPVYTLRVRAFRKAKFLSDFE